MHVISNNLIFIIFIINIIILYLLFNTKIMLFFLFFFLILIIMKVEKFLNIGQINLYDKMNKKILLLNIFLLIINIINIFLNVFRYLFYDIIKIIREYFRNMLLVYFNIEIPIKLNYYIDNIVAYVSWDVVWLSITIFILLYYLYLSNWYFDWKREDLLLSNIKLCENLFWSHRSQLLCDIYVFSSCYWRLYFGICVCLRFFFEIIVPTTGYFEIFMLLFIICLIINFIYWLQFNIAYYKYHLKTNTEYLKWKE